MLFILILCCRFFFFKQKTAYELRISDWSSDVCSSDLAEAHAMLGGEFLAGNGRLGSFAGESNRNALLVASTLPMVAYAMRTRLLPLVLAVPILVMLLWGTIGRASCRERVCQYV